MANKVPEDDKETQSPAQETKEVDQPAQERKGLRFGSKKLWLFILPLVLLAGGLLFATYQYSQSASRAEKLDSEIATLQQAVADKDIQLAELQEAPEDGADATETNATCTGSSTYTADVGNFTASLDEPYVIIRELDAGFEGGPATRLSTASCLEDETNVFDSPYQRDVNILANPQSSAADLRSSYESRNGALTAGGTVDVDGVTANRYTMNALFETTVLFFDRGGIGYQIEASGTPSEFNPLLDDVVDDWGWES